MHDIDSGDVLPDGKTSFSLTMTCRRSGAARNTLLIQLKSHGNFGVTNPKKATTSQHVFDNNPGGDDSPARHHKTRLQYPNVIPSRPSSSRVIISKAGIMPTNPAARGIVPVATATVWRMTFSWGVNGFFIGSSFGMAAGRVLRSPKPTRADWRDIIDTQPSY